MPHMTKDGNLHNIESQFDIKMGPGATLTGEMLWDQSQVRPDKGPKLLVKLAALFSLSENLVIKNAEKMEEVEEAGDEALDKLRTAVAEEHKEQLNERDKEILRLQTQNEKLKEVSQKIEENIKKPDDTTIKSSAEN